MAKLGYVKSFRCNSLVDILNNDISKNDTFFNAARNHGFRLCVQEYWNIFLKDTNGGVPRSCVIELFSLILKLFFPYIDKAFMYEFMEEEIYIITEHKNKSLLLKEFIEIMISFYALFSEQESVESCNSFYRYFYDRITVISIKYNDGSESKLRKTITHQFHENSKILPCIEQIQQEKLPFNYIFYEEKVSFNKQEYEECLKNPNCVVKCHFLPADQLTPLGKATLNQIVSLKNGSQLEITSNSSLKQFLTVDEKLFFLAALIPHYKNSNCYFRVNPVLDRAIFFEHLKSSDGTYMYFNTKSPLHEILDIDPVYRLAKDREAKKKSNYQDPALLPDHTFISESKLWDLKNIIAQGKYSFIKQMSEIDIVLEPDHSDPTHLEKEEDFIPHKKSLVDDLWNTYTKDLLYYAKKDPFRVLLIGKPKVGKTTIAKELSKKLDMEYVDFESIIIKKLEQIKEKLDNPETDDEGNVKDNLTKLEKKIKEQLYSGQRLSHDSMIELLNTHLSTSANLLNKGFIYELDSYENPLGTLKYFDKIKQGIIKFPYQLEPQIEGFPFNLIIELSASDEEMYYQASTILENPDPEKWGVTSAQDRKIIKKKVELDEDGNPIDDGEEVPPPIPKDKLFFRVNEAPYIIEKALKNYTENIYPDIQQIRSSLAKSQYIELNHFGLTNNEIVEIICKKIGQDAEVLRPLTKDLEGASNFADLLSLEIDLEQGQPARKWSSFLQTDPVAYFNKKIIPGKPEFACDFASRVFVFDNEENFKFFKQDPKKYLQEIPKMISEYNIAIVGPAKIGKKCYAKKLSELYGWKIFDPEEYIAKKVAEQSTWTEHRPSNPETGEIHFSATDLALITSGAGFPMHEILPLLLFDNGIALQKRPPKPVEPMENEQEEELRLQKEEEERKKKEEEEKKKARRKTKKEIEEEERKKREEEERIRLEEAALRAELGLGPDDPLPPPPPPPPPPPEDINLRDLSIVKPENGIIPSLKGYIFINFPLFEEHTKALTEYNIVIDKLIVLTDTDGDEQGKNVVNRPEFYIKNVMDNELAIIEKSTILYNEVIGDSNVKVINIVEGNEEASLKNIQIFLDPFFLKIDEEGTFRESSGGGQVEPIPFSQYGDYCVVTLADEGWLMPAKDDKEVQVLGKKYRFYDEVEMEKFKYDPRPYVAKENLTIPGPRIMIAGPTGSGVKTQLNALYEKFKLITVDFKNEFLEFVQLEKESRRLHRKLHRTFKNPEFDEETGKEVPDPELDEEGEDFNKRAVEITQIKKIFDGLDGLFINGNFFDIDEELVSTASIVELLADARRLPELFIILTVKPETVKDRLMDRKGITEKYQSLVDERNKKIAELKAERFKQKKEEREEKIKQMKEEGEDTTELENEPIEEDDGPVDVDMPEPDLSQMLQVVDEEFTNRRDKETSLLERFKSEIDDQHPKIKAVEISADDTKPIVLKKIIFELKNFVEKRESLLEKFQTRIIKEASDPSDELFTSIILKNILSNYNYKKSLKGNYHVLNASEIPLTQEYPIVYRNRIYFCSNAEEQQLVAAEPLKYITSEVIPTDINYMPRIFMIGKYKSGKSKITKYLSDKLGLIRIKISDVIKKFVEQAEDLNGFILRSFLEKGQCPPDEIIIDLLMRRLQLNDVQQNGFILDGFPNTFRQATILTKVGLIPHLVLKFNAEIEIIQKRLTKKNTLVISNENDIIHLRQNEACKDENSLEDYYLYHFGNIKYIDPSISVQGNADDVKKYLSECVKNRMDYARSFTEQGASKAFEINTILLNEDEKISKLSPITNINLVLYKKKKAYVRSPYYGKSRKVIYNKQIYFFSTIEEAATFSANPELFINLKIQLNKIPKKLSPFEYVFNQYPLSLKGYCPVDIVNQKINKGFPHLCLCHKQKLWRFSSAENLIIFMQSPHLYENIKLPDKLPIIQIPSAEDDAKSKGSQQAYLENQIKHILISVLSTLGQKRMKYPMISCKESALKFLAICLKSNNNNQSKDYREKYDKNLKIFLDHCMKAENLHNLNARREKLKTTNEWTEWDEEYFLRQTEDYDLLLKDLIKEEKQVYFNRFIRDNL